MEKEELAFRRRLRGILTPFVDVERFFFVPPSRLGQAKKQGSSQDNPSVTVPYESVAEMN